VRNYKSKKNCIFCRLVLAFLGKQYLPNFGNYWKLFTTFDGRAIFFNIVFFTSVFYYPKQAFFGVRASPAVLSMWSCTLKLDEEKSKHPILAYGKWFCISISAHFCGGW
jgi:hypothetical protein